MWASNSDSEVNSNFAADVGAELNGLPVSGRVEVDIKTTSQYSKFSDTVQQTCSCNGGNTTLATAINTDPAAKGIYQTFLNWSQSIQLLPDVTGFHSETLWSIMAFAKDEVVASYSTHVENAYDYLVSNPQIHKTACRMIVSSDWGEIALLSPSAYIEANPRNPAPPGTILTATKVVRNSAGGGTDVGRFVTVE